MSAVHHCSVSWGAWSAQKLLWDPPCHPSRLTPGASVSHCPHSLPSPGRPGVGPTARSLRRRLLSLATHTEVPLHPFSLITFPAWMELSSPTTHQRQAAAPSSLCLKLLWPLLWPQGPLWCGHRFPLPLGGSRGAGLLSWRGECVGFCMTLPTCPTAPAPGAPPQHMDPSPPACGAVTSQAVTTLPGAGGLISQMAYAYLPPVHLLR